MPIIRIPRDAPPEVRETFQQIQTILTRLTGDRNINHHGRRTINAGDAVDAKDYVTLRQLQRLLTESIAASGGGEQSVTQPGSVLVPPILIVGFTEGSVLFVGSGGQAAQNNALFRWDDVNGRLIVDGEIHEAIWRGEVLAVDVGGTGLSGGMSGGILAFVAPDVLQSSAELGEGLIIVGGGAGATPSTDALLGGDPIAPPDGSAWLVQTSATAFEVRARISGVTRTLTAAAIVNVDALGAIDGDGSPGDPLAVITDGVTIEVNPSNELEVIFPASYYPIKFTVGDSAPIGTGVKQYTYVIPPDGGGDFVSWDLRSAQSASLEVNVRKGGSSVTSGNNPELVAATQDDDNDLSDWSDTAVAAGNVITIDVVANDNSEFFELTLFVLRS